MTIYQELEQAGCWIESYESDLYVEATPEAVKICKGQTLTMFAYFHNEREGGLWIEVPFAYDPFWEAREK